MSIDSIIKRAEKIINHKLTYRELDVVGNFAYNHDYNFSDDELAKALAS